MLGLKFFKNTIGATFDCSAHFGQQQSWGFDIGETDGNKGLLVLGKVASVFLGR